MILLRYDYKGYNGFTINVEMVYWTLVLISMYMNAYILMTFELTDFKLCTAVNADNTVSIIGLNINGNEIFKFNIDEACINSHKEHLPELQHFMKKTKKSQKDAKGQSHETDYFTDEDSSDDEPSRSEFNESNLFVDEYKGSSTIKPKSPNNSSDKKK